MLRDDIASRIVTVAQPATTTDRPLTVVCTAPSGTGS
jgi:hypothetical protein